MAPKTRSSKRLRGESSQPQPQPQAQTQAQQDLDVDQANPQGSDSQAGPQPTTQVSESGIPGQSNPQPRSYLAPPPSSLVPPRVPLPPVNPVIYQQPGNNSQTGPTYVMQHPYYIVPMATPVPQAPPVVNQPGPSQQGPGVVPPVPPVPQPQFIQPVARHIPPTPFAGQPDLVVDRVQGVTPQVTAAQQYPDPTQGTRPLSNPFTPLTFEEQFKPHIIQEKIMGGNTVLMSDQYWRIFNVYNRRENIYSSIFPMPNRVLPHFFFWKLKEDVDNGEIKPASVPDIVKSINAIYQLSLFDWLAIYTTVGGEHCVLVQMEEQLLPNFKRLCLHLYPRSIRLFGWASVTRETSLQILEIDGTALEYMSGWSKDPEIIKVAVESNPLALQFVDKSMVTYDVALKAFKRNPYCWEYINDGFRGLMIDREVKKWEFERQIQLWTMGYGCPRDYQRYQRAARPLPLRPFESGVAPQAPLANPQGGQVQGAAQESQQAPPQPPPQPQNPQGQQ